MTAKEMQKAVMQQTQAMEGRTFPSEDVELYLNKAIYKFVRDQFEPRANREQLGFEQSIKRVEDIRPLITTKEVDTTHVDQLILDGIYADKAKIPEDQFLTISIGLKVFYNTGGITYTTDENNKRIPDGDINNDYGERRINAKYVQHDDLFAVLKDPFHKPTITRGLYSIDNDNVYSYTSSEFLTDKIVLKYIRQPAQVSLSEQVDCDLSPSVHEEIVDLAANLLLSDVSQINNEG